MILKRCLIASLMLGSMALPFTEQLSLAGGARAAQLIATESGYNLDFDPTAFKRERRLLKGKAVTFRAYRDLVYVKHPVSVKSQSLNLFIPEGYFTGEKVHGYTKDTAPIFMPNGVGYMPGKAGEPLELDPLTERLMPF